MPPDPYHFLDPRKPVHTREIRPDKPLPRHIRKFGYLPDAGFLLPGDLILVHNLKLPYFSKAIVSAQRNGGYQEEDARWHHAAVYIDGYLICEAQLSGVKTDYLYQYIPTHLIRIRRDVSLLPDDRWKIVVNALRKLREPYGFRSIVALYWQSKIGFWRPILRFGYTRGVICSQLYAEAYSLVTHRLLVPGTLGRPTPADLSLTPVLTDIPIDWIKLQV